MKEPILYLGGTNAATRHAGQLLQAHGLIFSPTPTREVTHLLLDTPCKGEYSELLNALSLDVTVLGGRLSQFAGYRFHDLLSDPLYLAHNASITAHCTLQVLLPLLPVVLTDCPILVLGCGRIGKCLSSLLHRMGAKVSVFARKDADRAMISAFGLTAVTSDTEVGHYRAIINTIPNPVLTPAQLRHRRRECALIELASTPGLIAEDVVPALGLPGKLAPESSGALISQTVIRLLNKEEI